jgi:hypothetical protein
MFDTVAAAAARVPMTATRRISLTAGIFLVITFVTSIPAVVLYNPVLKDSNYILGAGADARLSFGALLEIILVIANIGTAVVLFPILKRQSEGLALGYVACRIVESTIIAVGIVSVLSVITLRKDFAGVAGTDHATLVATGKSLVAIHDATFLLGPAFCAGIGNGILLGYLMYRSGLVPRGMAMLGLIGGPLAVITATAVLFGAYKQTSGWSLLLTLPEIAWEASLGSYLIVKGFKPARITSRDVPPVGRRAGLAPV